MEEYIVDPLSVDKQYIPLPVLAEEDFPQGCYRSGRQSRLVFLAGCDEVGRGALAGPVVAATVMVYLNIVERKKSATMEYFSKFLKFLKMLHMEKVDDSKRLSSYSRKSILKRLGIDPARVTKDSCYYLECNLLSEKERAQGGDVEDRVGVLFSVAEISSQEIDRINIFNAALKAMRRSFFNCYSIILRNVRRPADSQVVGNLLIDGIRPIGLGQESEDYYGNSEHARRVSSVNDLGSIVNEVPIVGGDRQSKVIALASIIAKEYRDLLMEKLDAQYAEGGYGFKDHVGYPTKKHISALNALGPSLIHRFTYAPVKKAIRH
ncbi:MAG: ribonuclease HII [Oligoflexia bacterium]|nr:ribonuclease HII [Oligoflexia bacterium]